MTFRVNHNVPAVNSHRNLQMNDVNLSKNLERLSSGVKINRAVDGPAAFMISEHMRSQIAGLDQAIDNSEVAVSLIQTTDANMSEVSSLLNRMRQLAIHAANEGPNNAATLEADQSEIHNILQTIGDIAGKAQFGNVKLLDGSMEATGTTTGDNLEFVGASLKTGDSRENGFEVRIKQLATKAHVIGKTALTQEIISAGETLTVFEDGKSASYTTTKDDTADIALKNLQAKIDRAGIQVQSSLDEAGNINLNHKQYGSAHSFQVTSSTAGVLSEQGGQINVAAAGKDIIGTINGETTIGKGQILTGIDGSKCVDGLKVRFYGEGKDFLRDILCEVEDKPVDGEPAEGEQEQKPEIPPEGVAVGRVFVTQNGTKFQIGGNKLQTAGISIKGVHPDTLATNIVNQSDFNRLSDVDVRTFQGAQDTIMLVDEAINQITSNRADLGAFQKNTLESNLSNIRIANENLVSSESIIRDTDMAKEMASFTKNQIMSQSSNAMLAQANQMPQRVLQLLG
ncbi:flagellin [bacterium]|nr:flagellin [bacterium]